MRLDGHNGKHLMYRDPKLWGEVLRIAAQCAEQRVPMNKAALAVRQELCISDNTFRNWVRVRDVPFYVRLRPGHFVADVTAARDYLEGVEQDV